MCSRYAVGKEPKEVAARFGVAAAPGLEPMLDLQPGLAAPVILAAPERRMTLLKWGLLPGWAEGPSAKPQINARAESAADKPFFREAFRRRRALVPADAWWERPKKGKDKTPRWFSLKSGELFAFAGLWEPGSFSVVTVEACSAVSPYHDRMPAILSRDAEDAWLDPRTPPERLRELLRPCPPELLASRRTVADPQGDLFG